MESLGYLYQFFTLSLIACRKVLIISISCSDIFKSGDALCSSLSCFLQAARVFESQLADSLLEGDGQLAFKRLAAATVETLMPKIETKGEFGQARWRLVSAPQVPNLLSLDPTTDPFKSLANLSFGAEVEVQLGKHLQVSCSINSVACTLSVHMLIVYWHHQNSPTYNSENLDASYKSLSV